MFDRRLVENFDWVLLGLTLAVALMGLVTLYSAVTAGVKTGEIVLFHRQLLYYGIGFAGMAVTLCVDYKHLERFAPAFYIASVLLLLFVLLFGTVGGGARRWLFIGPLSIQPSEVAKIAVIAVLARYYSRMTKPEGYTLRDLVKPVLLVLVPFLLIMKQPDLGTAMHIGLIAAMMTVFIKIERRSFFALLLIVAIAVPLAWSMLKPYQIQRLMTFLDPNLDPLGAGYHIIQSKIAIGSGMVFGKGFLEGTQNALSFLPEQHTDFIFSVLAEEWGLLGSGILLTVFFLLVLSGIRVAYGCRELFGMMLAVGITGMIFSQVIVNAGMVMGLLPVVGVPLPFVSKGGTSVILMMVSMGILLNIRMRRFMFE